MPASETHWDLGPLAGRTGQLCAQQRRFVLADWSEWMYLRSQQQHIEPQSHPQLSHQAARLVFLVVEVSPAVPSSSQPMQWKPDG